MTIQTPAQVAANRTARLVAEVTRPVFTSTRMSERARMLMRADEFAGSDDDTMPWCHICSRPTDHRGEHDDEQLERFARSRLGKRLMGTW